MAREWGGLRGIFDEARVLDDELARAPLIDCPRCGTRLDVNARGERNCPMGHYRTTAQTQGGA